MARPRQISAREALTRSEIAAAAYVGSKEHKSTRWWDGLPGAHVDEQGEARRPRKLKTTICPMVSEEDRQRATLWVRHALAQDQTRFYEGDKLYPKHIWHLDANGRYRFGFCINGIAGTYKGWPIDESEKRETFG